MRKTFLLVFCSALLLGAMLTASGLTSSARATAAERTALMVKTTVAQTCPPTIRNGSQGSWVKKLQQQLNDLGWRDQNGKKLVVDGTFGSKTEFVVKNFQSVYAPPADGIVGPKTWHALNFC